MSMHITFDQNKLNSKEKYVTYPNITQTGATIDKPLCSCPTDNDVYPIAKANT
jgi:hypothetical protein